jgi:hypothetical protein
MTYDFSRKCVHIDTSGAQNANAMMAVEKRPIGPGFQAARPSRQQRTLQSIRIEPFKLGQLRIT